jgi:hypothetical protein
LDAVLEKIRVQAIKLESLILAQSER